MAEPDPKAIGQALTGSGPELRQWDVPWYKRIPYAITDAVYGPNANAQQGAWVNKLAGTENPLNILGQAQESGETLGRGVKFGDAATAGIGALGAGLAMMGFGGRGRAMAPEGMGAARSALPEPKPQGITAYHGSPHDFDRFDMSKIGTGEGAQAYGHGLYFAENEGVAKSYKNTLGRTHNLGTWADKSTVDGAAYTPKDPAHLAAFYQGNYGKEALATAEAEFAGHEMQRRLAKQFGQPDPGPNETTARAIEILKSGNVPKWAGPGKMYEVRINASPDDFLDWDKPLSQQSEKVRGAWDDFKKSRPEYNDPSKVGGQYKEPTGQQFYSATFEHVPGMGEKARGLATQELKKYGFPGIRYLDQGSRTAGEGSRNYVVFDDKLIDILRKYGLVGMLGAGSAASYATDPQSLGQELMK